MPGDVNRIKEIFNEKLDTLAAIEDLLSKDLRKNHDVSWGVSVVKEMGVYFNRLRDLDNKQNELAWLESSRNDTEILNLANKIQGSMNNVKRLMSLFSMRIKGGQEIIKGELRELVKAKKINGYKSMLV